FLSTQTTERAALLQIMLSGGFAIEPTLEGIMCQVLPLPPPQFEAMGISSPSRSAGSVASSAIAPYIDFGNEYEVSRQGQIIPLDSLEDSTLWNNVERPNWAQEPHMVD
ncbi:hypothetical protein THAOC_36198, partial [Thalassiosira oceanica]